MPHPNKLTSKNKAFSHQLLLRLSLVLASLERACKSTMHLRVIFLFQLVIAVIQSETIYSSYR